jgi:hypothetical protein
MPVTLVTGAEAAPTKGPLKKLGLLFGAPRARGRRAVKAAHRAVVVAVLGAAIGHERRCRLERRVVIELVFEADLLLEQEDVAEIAGRT